MTYFGPEQVERVREATDLVALVGRWSQPKASGSHHVACCPIHSERSPSMQIYQDHVHCFGCGFHGDGFALLQAKENLTFQEAVQELAREARVELKPVERKPTGQEDQTAPLYAAMEFAAAHYEAALQGCEPAMAYLRERGMDERSIRHFRLGWADGTMARAATDQGLTLASLVSADLAREDGRDRFWQRVTIPILDSRGRPIAFTARILPADEARLEADGKKVGKYINSTETPIFRKGSTVFNLHRARTAVRALRERRGITVVEGALDVIGLVQAGEPAAVACLGTAMTEEHAAALAAVTPADAKIFLGFDGDDAGQKARRPAVRHLLATGASVEVISLASKDPWDLMQEPGGRDQWRNSLNHGTPGLEWLLQEQAPKGKEDPEPMRLAVLDDLLAILATVPDRTLREMQVERVAKHLGIPVGRAKQRSRAAADAAASDPSTTSVSALPLTDYGMARRFLARCRDRVLYCPQWQSWVVWDGTIWQTDDDAAFLLCHKELKMALVEEAEVMTTAGKTDRAERIRSFAYTVDSHDFLGKVCRFAQKFPEWKANESAFDADPAKVCTRAGVVDLATGELRPYDPALRMTRMMDADHTAPVAEMDAKWAAFVERMAGSAEVAAYLRRFVGYAATGWVREKAIVILQGEGDSGKTTFVNAIKRVFSAYGGNLNPENFLMQQQQQKRWELANADHARFVAVEETGQDGRVFAIDFLKSATGGNEITAERKSQQPYTFKPQWKLLFVCNDAPSAPAGDQATWNRINLVRCAPPPKVLDRSLGDAFASEDGRAAILRWILAGARDYLTRRSLDAPEAVRLSTAAHRGECDWLVQFLDEAYLPTGQESDKVGVTDFMRELEAWCSIHTRTKPTSKSVSRRMAAWGIEGDAWIYDRDSCRSVRAWSGLRRRNENDSFDSRWSSAAKPTATPAETVATHPAELATHLATHSHASGDAWRNQGLRPGIQTTLTHATAPNGPIPTSADLATHPSVATMRGECVARLSDDPATCSDISPRTPRIPLAYAHAREPLESSLTSSQGGGKESGSGCVATDPTAPGPIPGPPRRPPTPQPGEDLFAEPPPREPGADEDEPPWPPTPEPTPKT